MSSVWFALLFSSLSGKRGGFHVISSGVLCEAVSVKYAFIEKSLTDRVIGRYSPLSLKRACHLLKVSHSGFARWKSVKDQSHAHGVVHSDAMIVTQTKALINENHGYIPGVINLYHQLQNKGYRVDVKRLRCLLRNNGIVHRWHRKYITTTDSNHNMPISPNLLKRQFDKFGINEAWCGDITYIDTEDGWLYLASVIDLGTRRLVGYAIDKRMTTELISKALRKAYDDEQPEPGCIFHSDRGSQYCSRAFQDLLSEYFMQSSMSRRGQCWDNAPAESFWATLKREILPTSKSFSSYELAKQKIEKWIMYYNSRRPHSKLGGIAPNAFYSKQLAMV